MTTQPALSHRERLQAVLSGQASDRTPLALWRHFPVDDQSPEGLAAATAAFQHAFDFDLIKVTPSSSFCLKDWGVTDRWTGNPEGTRDYTGRAIHKPQDWGKLAVLDPTQGHLGQQISCLNLLTAAFRPATPVIQTIFSPMAQAKNLVGGDVLMIHLRRYPDALHKGLEIITQSTLRFIEAARETGIDGVFYAIQHAQYGLLTPTEFETFGVAYDLRILEATHDLWLNLLHLHGSDVMFEMANRYPAAIVNWHDRESGPSLQDGQQHFAGTVCGGLRQWDTMVLGSPDQVRAEAEEAIRATGGRRFILGTGCVLPTTAPYGNIQAARQVVLGARP
jgi:uroporphyrinogen decarboxylase